MPSPAHTAAVTHSATAKPAPKPASPLESLDRRLKQRLARGTQTIDDRLDLHGKTQSEAHAALIRFLRRAQRDGARFVLVAAIASSYASMYFGQSSRSE